MELYFLRHAIAAEKAEAGVAADVDRPLTSEGAQKMKKAAEGMKKLNLGVDKIIASPYIRAKHTAEIAAEGLGFGGKIRLSDALIPNAVFRDFSKLLKEQAANARLLLVGHQPSMGDFVSELVTGNQGGLSIDFKKGSLCLVEIHGASTPVSGVLVWSLTSKQLGLMADG